MKRPLHPYFRHPGWPHPAAIAHRGFSARHPENTMAAFAAAVELGYPYVETDVHATRDGVLVAFHDDLLDRVTDRRGAVSELNWSDIRRARVGGTGEAGRVGGTEPIPLLEELLTTWVDLRVNIDPKADSAIAPLLDVLERMDAWDRVCVGSFSGRRLARIRKVAGDRLCTSMGPAEVVRLRLASLGLPVGGFDAFCVQVPPRDYGLPVVDRWLMRAARSRRLPVHVWTINDDKDMHRLLDIGVDGIMTDEAERLKAVYEQRGYWPGSG
ncbi:MAG: glycerophosphodiester phosphodiesterase [Paracoccaceae bacterium]|nr:glycerophosphodiester phosphodiesterase [Paracoccaceae bacterium]